MGEMIKFGIKLGMSIACAVALVAAVAALFFIIPSFSNTSSFVGDLFFTVSIALPFKIRTIFLLVSPLFAFKIAYWAADKMIQFIDSLG